MKNDVKADIKSGDNSSNNILINIDGNKSIVSFIERYAKHAILSFVIILMFFFKPGEEDHFKYLLSRDSSWATKKDEFIFDDKVFISIYRNKALSEKHYDCKTNNYSITVDINGIDLTCLEVKNRDFVMSLIGDGAISIGVMGKIIELDDFKKIH
jgi:hypothetical protein